MIPTNKRNILWRDDLDSWPHLKQVCIAHIDKDVSNATADWNKCSEDNGIRGNN